MTHRIAPRLIALTLTLMLALPAIAQNLFAPAATVNDRVVTAFEVDQRARMLSLFRTPGDLRQQALQTLIDERLQLSEGDRVGVTVTSEQVSEGMAEFAQRANLSAEDFIAALAVSDVDVQSFQDFVRAGVVWREVVRQRFGGRIRITPQEVDRLIAAPPPPSLRVLLRELILPANTPQNAARAEALVPTIAAITTEAAFIAAARQYSASPSRAQGGALDFLPVENLPPALRPQLLAAQPGQVIGPLPIPNGIAFFQVRALEEGPATGAVTELDYAAWYIPGGRSAAALTEAAQLQTRVQTCDDLYTIARAAPQRLQRDVLPPAQVPGDVALELAKLDVNEVSTALTRADGQTLVFLMLCARSYRDAEVEIDRDRVGDTLTDRRAADLARNYLAELRANADIQITE